MNTLWSSVLEGMRTLYRERVTASLVGLAVASIACLVLVAGRMYATGSRGYLFLVWNLFLAWLPFLTAYGLYAARPRSRTMVWGAGAAWLLFFPNAPYIITDLIHLRWGSGAPIWYDAAMIAAFAWTGMMLGLTSLRMMQSLVRQRVGKVVSWLFACAVLALGSFGMYLGRFERWNSWDVLTNPSGLAFDILHRVLHPLQHIHTVAVTALFTLVLLVAYVTTLAFSTQRVGITERES